MKIAGMETGQVTKGRVLTVVGLSITLIWVLVTGDDVEEATAAPDAPSAAVNSGTTASTESGDRDREIIAPGNDWRRSVERSRVERPPLDRSMLEAVLVRDPFVRAPKPVVEQIPDPVLAVPEQPVDDARETPAPASLVAKPPKPVRLIPESLHPEFIALAADGAASFVLDGEVYHVGDVLADGSVVKSITLTGVTTTRLNR